MKNLNCKCRCRNHASFSTRFFFLFFFFLGLSSSGLIIQTGAPLFTAATSLVTSSFRKKSLGCCSSGFAAVPSVNVVTPSLGSQFSLSQLFLRVAVMLLEGGWLADEVAGSTTGITGSNGGFQVWSKFYVVGLLQSRVHYIKV